MGTFVDIAGIMVAYTTRIHQSSFLIGSAYGMFKAVIVVQIRTPIARVTVFVIQLRGRRPWKGDVYMADL